MKTDFKKLKPAPRMKDPLRFPRVQLPLENEMKQSYKLQQSKLLIDLTKAMVDMKTK